MLSDLAEVTRNPSKGWEPKLILPTQVLGAVMDAELTSVRQDCEEWVSNVKNEVIRKVKVSGITFRDVSITGQEIVLHIILQPDAPSAHARPSPPPSSHCRTHLVRVSLEKVGHIENPFICQFLSDLLMFFHWNPQEQTDFFRNLETYEQGHKYIDAWSQGIYSPSPRRETSPAVEEIQAFLKDLYPPAHKVKSIAKILGEWSDPE